MKHQEQYRVTSFDVDLNNTLTPCGVLRYFQETAYMQHYKYGPSITDLQKNHMAFVLSRVSMSIYREIYPTQTVTCETWSNEPVGIGIHRYATLKVEDLTVAEISSVWALIDTENKKILKSDSLPLGFDHDEDELQIPIPGRIHIPKDLDMRLVGEHIVSYSDVDFNQHMNNTIYPNVLCNCLPNLFGKRVVGLTINYVSEAKLGESFKIYYCETEENCYFKTIKDDGKVGIEAEMIIDEIY